MQRAPWTALALAATVLAAGCATAPAPGASRDEVIARMGRPTDVVRLPGGGERLQYSGQPAGQWAFMADLDVAGRLAAWRQVLTEEDFGRIEIGRWTREDVLREFGRPAFVERVALWDGPVFTYRWQTYPGANWYYWVHLDPQGVVRRAYAGAELLSADPIPN